MKVLATDFDDEFDEEEPLPAIGTCKALYTFEGDPRPPGSPLAHAVPSPAVVGPSSEPFQIFLSHLTIVLLTVSIIIIWSMAAYFACWSVMWNSYRGAFLPQIVWNNDFIHSFSISGSSCLGKPPEGWDADGLAWPLALEKESRHTFGGGQLVALTKAGYGVLGVHGTASSPPQEN